MFRLLDRASQVVDRVMAAASALLIAAIIALVLVSIGMRNAGVQFVGAYEYTRVLFLWASFLGITVAFRRKAHVCVNVLHDALPTWTRRAFGAITTTTALIFFVVSSYVGFGLLDIVASQRMPSTGLSARWLYMPVIVSFIVMAFHTVVELARFDKLHTAWSPAESPDTVVDHPGTGVV